LRRCLISGLCQINDRLRQRVHLVDAGDDLVDRSLAGRRQIGRLLQPLARLWHLARRRNGGIEVRGAGRQLGDDRCLQHGGGGRRACARGLHGGQRFMIDEGAVDHVCAAEFLNDIGEATNRDQPEQGDDRDDLGADLEVLQHGDVHSGGTIWAGCGLRRLAPFCW
jgi:hypothetical protein